jgi:hypothetical protein
MAAIRAKTLPVAIGGIPLTSGQINGRPLAHQQSFSGSDPDECKDSADHQQGDHPNLGAGEEVLGIVSQVAHVARLEAW